jgi:RimJ/RimL family protein N-acetyltransferase
MVYGERVRLRPIEREDLPRFVAWFRDPEVRRHLSVYLPFSLAQEERWFEAHLHKAEEGSSVLMAIDTAEGVHIGNIGLESINWKDRAAELGIVIGEKQVWDQGYGTDALRTMLGVGFRQMNLHRIFLRVDADNARGIRCYQKAGLRHEGALRDAAFRDGVYLDQHIMSILAHEYIEQGKAG